MFQRKIFVFFIAIYGVLPGIVTAQKLLKDDVAALVKTIPVLPMNVEASHNAYSSTTTQGNGFSAAGLNLTHEKMKSCLSAIHDATIRKIISASPRSDMPFNIQYDEERARLSLRPLKGAAMLKNGTLVATLGQEIVKELVELEKSFDWQQYYKAYDKNFKMSQEKQAWLRTKLYEMEEKVPTVKTEWGMQKDADKLTVVTNQIAKEKVAASVESFRLQAETWQLYFTKYAAAATRLQKLLEKISYTEKTFPGEVSAMLADVQARSFEALERMVWQEMLLVQSGELVWQEQDVLKLYHIN